MYMERILLFPLLLSRDLPGTAPGMHAFCTELDGFESMISPQVFWVQILPSGVGVWSCPTHQSAGFHTQFRLLLQLPVNVDLGRQQ